MSENVLDLQKIRQKLANKHGKAYWRSLEEIAETDEFQHFLDREYPHGTTPGVSRRRFLQLAAAALALAGIAACSPEGTEKIIPYVNQPEEIVQGEPLFFATAHVLDGFANGILAKSLMGRPIKLEGNPDHPASGGKTDWYTQAELLTLYDPDRSQVILQGDQIKPRVDFFDMLESVTNIAHASDGRGLRILTTTVTSPMLASQLDQLQQQLPQMRWHQWDAVNRDNIYDGTRLAFDLPLEPVYDFSQADVVVSLDADFLGLGPGKLAYTRQFSDQRRVRAGQDQMNRLYVVEGTPSLTGAQADHRWQRKPSRIIDVAKAISAALGYGEFQNPLPDHWQNRITALVNDLQDHAGASLLVAGYGQPPEVHALCHWINHQLDNTGKTVTFTQPVVTNPENQRDSLFELVNDMNNGDVDTLLIIGGNPIYNAPADIDLAGAMSAVEFTAHIGLYANETSHYCDWHVPRAHMLESWGDARAYDGTVTFVQPLIAPLYNGLMDIEVLGQLAQTDQSPYDMLRQHWESLGDMQWKQALRDGLIADSAYTAVDVTPQDFDLPETSTDSGIELIFKPDHSLYDGRYNNNGWLQETPRPFTKLTWDNAALISPATAEELGINNEDLLRIVVDEQRLDVPAWILPGQADSCITLHLGYGREQTGNVGKDTGFNTYQLRTTDHLWFVTNAQVNNTNAVYPLATTQHHHGMQGRDIVRIATLTDFVDHSNASQEETETLPSMYPERLGDAQYQWGMSIDLTTCTGCNACMVACQAENNIPIVGKEQVQVGREMHWIRVDSYYGGTVDDPDLLQQPVTCMHCENAPCEPVCPVNATTHSSEGLNQMTYNRCVGTRYCSNNCPYKVRRFNFLNWEADPDLAILNNPDVTVRARGVMEKCSYCLQRINRARVQADLNGILIRDRDLQTACQQACPADAIVFGDISNPDSAVAQNKAHPHDYSLLHELGTRPRTTYLSQIRNPNPEIEE